MAHPFQVSFLEYVKERSQTLVIAQILEREEKMIFLKFADDKKL